MAFSGSLHSFQPVFCCVIHNFLLPLLRLTARLSHQMPFSSRTIRESYCLVLPFLRPAIWADPVLWRGSKTKAVPCSPDTSLDFELTALLAATGLGVDLRSSQRHFLLLTAQDKPINHLQGSRKGCFERGTETISMDTWTREEEEPPFKGLPPLPKVFWGAHPSQELLPGVAEQEETKPLEGNCTSLHGKISWVQNEVLSLRRSDLALFHRLYLLALEIQDLSELHQEMETFSKEQLAAEDPNRAGDRKATAPNPPFELSI
ncbi:uncharacterized protein PHA67_002720 isoform 1-T1 [Liasis olivaceus]